MLRIELGIIIGLIVGTIAFMLFQMFDSYVNSAPDGLNIADPETEKTYVPSLPSAVFLNLLAGYAVGSSATGFIARLVPNSNSGLILLLIGILFSLGLILDIYAIPHPWWVEAVGFLMYLPFSILGNKLAGVQN